MERVLKRKWFRSLGLLALLVCAAQVTPATTITTPPTDDDMLIGARAVVRGKVVSLSTGIDEQNRIYTYITLKVQEVIKGQITEHKIIIKEEGGQYRDRGSLIFGAPQFAVGEKVILYLDTRADGSLRVHQMFFGKFSIVKDEQTGKEMAVRQAMDQNVHIVFPEDHDHARGLSTNQMELSSYIAMVRSRQEVNWEAAVKFEEENYAGIPVLARPAEYQDSRRGDIQPNFTLIHINKPRWFEPDSGLPVIFHVNPAGAPNSQILDDISAAMVPWSNVAGCALRVANGGATGNCLPSGSQNTIVFNNCDGRWAAGSGCQGVLALGGLSWTGETTVINGTTFRRATQGFISFNPFASCNFGNSCNVREITTHELGHALGLGHSEFSDATMWGIAHFDGRCASIRQDDTNGILFMYPSGAGGGGPLSIVTSTLTGSLINIPYTAVLIAAGGSTPYSWSLVSGSGALPPGLSLSSNGNITGTPTTAGNYNFTVRVTDSASATATKALSINVLSGSTALDSQFVSQTVPTTLVPGQTFTVNIKWTNTGTETWGTGFRVVSQNPPQNSTWGGNNVPLSGLFNVAQGQQLDLNFTVFAPTAPGTYNFQWQMWKDGPGFFGQMSTNVAIQVGSGGGGSTNNSTFVSQNVPGSMTAGQNYSVSVTMKNTGNTTWSTSSYKLGSQNPQDNNTWGLNRVSLPSSVAPNGDATFTFNVTAPTTPGTYNFQWRVIQEGSGFFGATSTNVAVQVAASGGTTNDASFVSQNVPASMTAGQVYSVSMRMKNSGTTTWSAANGYSLGSQNPSDNTMWGMSRVNLPTTVVPEAEVSFTINLVAPSTPGTYNFQWKMLKEGTGFFGAASASLTITVNPTAADSDGDSIPNTIETAEGTNPAVKDNAVFTNTRLFAMQQYRDFLGREADAGGLAFWTGQLNSSTLTRAQVIEQFFNSNEFQVGTAPITRLYMAYFLRIPDYEGLNYWLNQYRNGQTLPSISAEFAGSPEFVNRYGNLNNGDFVTLVYQNVLGRAPDSEGFNYYVGRLNSGSITRGGMMLDFSESTENKNRTYNKVYVTQMYLGLLRRVPDQAGYTQWVGQMDSGTPGVNLINSFMGLPEYHNRFLPPQ